MRYLAVLLLTALASVTAGGFQNGRPSPSTPGTPEMQLGRDVPAKHLALRIGAATATAVPGARIELIVSVTPGPRMHVYAPTDADYIPMDLKLDASDTITADPARFPPATQLFLPAVAQRVRVYAASFRITQPIGVARTSAVLQLARTQAPLTVTGLLTYQACDDSVCYRPESVPLQWKIPLAR